MAAGNLAAGQLLIASPKLEDSSFARSLVLLLDVDDTGCLGVVLNRPTEVSLDGVLDPWSSLACEPAVLFQGGPVEPEGALGVGVLAEGAPAPRGWRPVFDRAGVIDLEDPEVGSFAGVRIYAGYAGWGGGQLEAEVAEGAWYVVPAAPGDVCATDPEVLWRQVLRRQPEPLSLLLTMPLDPTVN
ncbi:YqgE/AlgH family protein [Nocardioides terrisoli]|uniref:YqgE/AlgH family protein n=1 Tax=Nocardioides terrisoli TaxID=3388267 RepID=UPI00287B9AE8|nr:YqgE/AlgH family protein [Nocardioides marmorisolisilvae]